MGKARPILVTGATGVAGHHVAQALERRGVHVLRISRRPPPGGRSVDITDAAAIEQLPDFAGVIHCAGLTPRLLTASWDDFHRSNVVGSVELAKVAVDRRVDFFVYIGTAGRLGRRHNSPVSRLYVLSKYLAERRIRQIVRDQVPALSLRAASLYGEHDRGSMSRLILSVAKGRFVLPTHGAVPKCLLYAGTLAGVIAEDVTSQPLVAWRARAIADLRSYTLADVVAAIEGVVGRQARRIPISPRLMALGIAPAELAGRLLGSRTVVELASGARTALTTVDCRSDNLLNEHPGQEVDLVDGVRREVEWLRASRLL